MQGQGQGSQSYCYKYHPYYNKRKTLQI
jgi:hypothetical protein